MAKMVFKRFLQFVFLLLVVATSSVQVQADPSLHFGPPYLSTGGFLRPFGIAVDETHGRLLVADTGNHRFKWTPISDLTGTYVFTEHGYIADRAHADALNSPQAIAADAAGNVYVVNPLSGTVKLFTWNGGSYSSAQTFCTVTVGSIDILMPRDIAVGSDDAVYLLDSGNKRILKADGPADTTWSVFHSDPSWKNPYGLTVDSSGTVYVADTGNHRIMKISAAGVTTFGHWGTGRGEFRFPRDIAVDQYGRMYVADTFNHRIAVLADDGHPLTHLGDAPAVSTIDKVVVDSSDRVFVVDSDNNHVIAYLGAGVPAQFDPFMRDYVGDPGSEPSDSFYSISSPDILVRHNPDVDVASVSTQGLEGIAFQQPLYEENNYVYVALHNRGTNAALDNFIKLYWIDPGTEDLFPEHWNSSGFYKSYTDAVVNEPENTLVVPGVDPGGTVVLGPFVWRPPSPESALSGNGMFRLGARVINPYDYPPTGDSLTLARDSNNVTERNLKVLRNPFSAGEQNTIVVRVHYPDLTDVTSEADVISKIAEMAAWVDETSWGVANVIAAMYGPVDLSQNSTYYNSESRNPLVEMTQEVIDKLLVTDPGIFNGTGPGHEIGRIILVTNLFNSPKDWSTTGIWPYDVGGETRYLSVSIHGGDSTTPELSHGLSHQLGMVDLYAHENITFSSPYADGWDNMAKPLSGAHPLLWSKEHAYWVTTHNARILYVPRPQPGTTWDNGGIPIPLYYQETVSAGQNVGIAFGLTNGITSFTDETAFYYVEARRNDAIGGADHNVIPQTGVIMYKAHSLIPQGQGPVIMQDHVAGGDLTDAAIPPGQSQAPLGTGISVTVQNGTSGADYDISASYTPPVTDYDVFMNRGDPGWKSPDIWVDNQANGYDEDQGIPPDNHDEQGIAGEENRVYARVFNAGPADASDVEVAFFFSEPYHTVDDVAIFDEFKSAFIDHIPAGSSQTIYVTWTPATGVQPHTCSRVKLRRLFNDTNSSNDQAQRNLQIDHSVHGSPYTLVEFPFQVGNSEDKPKLIYFRADGIPAGWKWDFLPGKVLLQPGASSVGKLMLQPPEGAPECTSHEIYVTGWTPRGDTLMRLGGSQLRVDLGNRTTISMKQSLEKCDKKQSLARYYPRHYMKGSVAEYEKVVGEQCVRLGTYGCTNPPQPNQNITVRYEGPEGEPYYQTVRTDQNGCYSHSFDLEEGGDWDVSVEFPGTECAGPATVAGTFDVPLQEVEYPEDILPDGERRLCITGISKDIEGEIVSSVPEKAVNSECKTKSLGQQLKLRVKSNGAFDNEEGEINIFNLRQILSSSDKYNAGLNRGRFSWKTKEMEIVGTVSGLTNVKTHNNPSFSIIKKPLTVPNHLELSLDGTVVKGSRAGQRLRAVMTLDSSGVRLKGALEGVLEKDCALSGETKKIRIRNALDLLEQQPMGPCREKLPCLRRISKYGKGELLLNQTGLDRCYDVDRKLCLDTSKKCLDSKSCTTDKTWSQLKVKFEDLRGAGGERTYLHDGVLSVKNFLQVLSKEGKGRGEHGGQFEFVSREGTIIRGDMLGVTMAGTHRKPSAYDIESFMEAGHLEGRLVGTIVNGKQKGMLVEARYVLELLEDKESSSLRTRHGKGRTKSSRLTEFKMNLDGWVIDGCLEAPAKQERILPPSITKVLKDQDPRPMKTMRRQVKVTSKIKDLVTKSKDLEAMRLPAKFYRPLSEVPEKVVRQYKKAAGGKLTNQAKLHLRMVYSEFKLQDSSKNGVLDVIEFKAFYGKNVYIYSRTELDKDKLKKNKKLVKRRETKGEVLEKQHLRRTRKMPNLKVAGDEFLSKKFVEIDKNSDSKIDLSEFLIWKHVLPVLNVPK